MDSDKRTENLTRRSAIGIPAEVVVTKHVKLKCTAAAIGIQGKPGKPGRLGAVTQLAIGTKLGVCGPGFSERTTKVQTQDGGFYFVFADDVEPASDDPDR